MHSKALNLTEVQEIFEKVPKLKKCGVWTGANVLFMEHSSNTFERYSLDIDIQTFPTQSLNHTERILKKSKLKLISRASELMNNYVLRLNTGKKVAIEIQAPYLKHRKKPLNSKLVTGLKVIHLADALFAKISAASSRATPRDFLDLLSLDTTEDIDWPKLLGQAAQAEDNDYNPSEFHKHLQTLKSDLKTEKDYIYELPCDKPPTKEKFIKFANKLQTVNLQASKKLLHI